MSSEALNYAQYKVLQSGQSTWGSSRYKLELKCALRYYFTYEAVGYPVESDVTEFTARGDLVHAGLAAFYQRVMIHQQGGNPEEWLPPGYAIRNEAERRGGEHLKQMETALAVVDAYIARVGLRETDRIIAVECPIRLVCGHTSSGTEVIYDPRVDLVKLTLTGALVGLDHKSTTSITEATFKGFERSLQFIGLDVAVRELAASGTIPGCKSYGGIRVNALSVRPPYKFESRPLYPGASAVAAFKARRVMQREQIELRQRQFKVLGELAYPALDNEDGCQGRYSTCPYWQRCRG